MAVLEMARTASIDARVLSSPRAIGAVGGLSVLGLLTYPLPLAWLALLALLVLGLARWRARGRPFPSTPFNVPLAIYLVAGGIALSVAIHPPSAELRFFGLFAGLAAFVLMAELPRSAEALHRAVLVSLIVVVVLTPVLMIIVYEFTLVAVLPEPVPTVMAALDPLRNAVLGSEDMLLRYRVRRSGMGALAAFGIALALGPLIAAPTKRIRFLALGAILFLLPFLLGADNRGSVLAIVLTSLLVLPVRHRLFTALSVLGLGVAVTVAVGLLLLPTLGWLLSYRADRADMLANVFYRTGLWDHILFLMGDYSFTGVGLGARSVREVYQTYFLPVEPPFSHAHSIFIQSFMEQGPLGLIGILLLTTLLCITVYRVLRRAHDPLTRSAAISSSAASLVLVLAGLTDIVPTTTVGMVMWLGALGLLVAVERHTAIEPTGGVLRRLAERVSPRVLKASYVVALLVLFLAASLVLPRQTIAMGAPAVSPWDAVASRVHLNLGSVELGKATLGSDETTDEREVKLGSAEMHLRQAKQLDPGNLGVDRQLAAVLAAQSSGSAARRVLNQAQEQAPPDDLKYKFQLARVYRDAGDTDRAIALWVQLDARQELAQWGDRLSRRGSWRSAAQVHLAVVRMAPSEPSAYPDLTEAVRRQDGRDAARALMLRLVAEYPHYPWAHIEIGELYARDGDVEQARHWFDEARKLDPEHRVVRQRLAAAETLLAGR